MRACKSSTPWAARSNGTCSWLASPALRPPATRCLLPAATLTSIRQRRLALKGPLTTPAGGGFRSSNVRMREEFELFGNVRPAKTLVAGRFDNIDVVLVRENLGGFYVAHAMDSWQAAARIAARAPAFARAEGRQAP